MRRIAAGLFSTIAVVLLLAPSAQAATVRAQITWNQTNDIDLYAFDGEGHEVSYADTDAIPEALLSSDVTDSGGPESFTDQQEPSTRPFGYRVCYFIEDNSSAGPTDVTLAIVDPGGARRTETFALAAPGDCRDAGDLSLLADADADRFADATDNCVQLANLDQADTDGDGTGDACDATPNGDPPPPPPPPPPIPEPEPEPEFAKSVVAGQVAGTIRVKGKNGAFRILGADETIPLGSTVDATKGKVRLTSAINAAGATQSALFFQGAFIITQTRGSKPITELALSGRLSCPKGKQASTSARKKVRRLWGDGKGRFRTKGKHGAATVRGTKWLTEDRCDGTLVRVKRGTVAVRDFAKKKTVVVKKGKSYVARAKRSGKK